MKRALALGAQSASGAHFEKSVPSPVASNATMAVKSLPRSTRASGKSLASFCRRVGTSSGPRTNFPSDHTRRTGGPEAATPCVLRLGPAGLLRMTCICVRHGEQRSKSACRTTQPAYEGQAEAVAAFLEDMHLGLDLRRALGAE